MTKLMVFIDGTWLYSNLRHLAKESNQPNFHIDYGALPQSILEEIEKTEGRGSVNLVRTFLFGSYPVNYDINDEDRARKRKDFFTMLREDYHYEVDAYPIDYQERRILYDSRDVDDQFSPKEKCVDIALASAMLYFASIPGAYDIAAAVVGDKDYFPVFQRVRQLGKRVAIASIKQSCAKMYSDRKDPKQLKDYHIFWLSDMIERIAWQVEETLVECRSPLHEGPRETLTTVRLREGQPFYCATCRAKFAEQKTEQMREFTATSLAERQDVFDEEGEVFEGVVDSLIPDRGFGFIKRADGASFFFHLTHLTNADWESIMTGAKTTFTVTKEPEGSKAGAASEVTVVFENDKTPSPGNDVED